MEGRQKFGLVNSASQWTVTVSRHRIILRGTRHVFLGLAIYKCNREKARQFNLHIVCSLYIKENNVYARKIYILTNKVM